MPVALLCKWYGCLYGQNGAGHSRVQGSGTNDIPGAGVGDFPHFIHKLVHEKKENKNSEIQLQVCQTDVVILYCDIVDFDKMIKYEQENIVIIMDNLFQTFDEFC